MGMQQGHSTEPDHYAVNQEGRIWSCRTHVVGSECQELFLLPAQALCPLEKAHRKQARAAAEQLERRASL